MTDELTSKDMICPYNGDQHDFEMENVAPDITYDEGDHDDDGNPTIVIEISLYCPYCSKYFYSSGRLSLLKGSSSWGDGSGWD